LPPDPIWPRVDDELRGPPPPKNPGAPAGDTRDATALVREAYPRLGAAAFADRGGFLRAAAVSMQRILVDHARRKRAARRGGHGRRFAVDEADRAVVPDPDTLLDVDEARNRLAAEDAGAADVARSRLLAGPSIDEAAEALGISRASAFRERADARSRLTAAPDGAAGPPDP